MLARSLKSSANGFLRTILSGLRTFITETSKRISTVGGSLRDVQMLQDIRLWWSRSATFKVTVRRGGRYLTWLEF